MKFIRLILMAIIGLFLIVFLVANRQPITISMDPFSLEDPAFALRDIPMNAALLIAMFGGYLLGAIGMWASGKGLRRKARDRKKEIKQLKQEADAAMAPTGETLPALRT